MLQEGNLNNATVSCYNLKCKPKKFEAVPNITET
jgi:hypothetical protein